MLTYLVQPTTCMRTSVSTVSDKFDVSVSCYIYLLDVRRNNGNFNLERILQLNKR